MKWWSCFPLVPLLFWRGFLDSLSYSDKWDCMLTDKSSSPATWNPILAVLQWCQKTWTLNGCFYLFICYFSYIKQGTITRLCKIAFFKKVIFGIFQSSAGVYIGGYRGLGVVRDVMGVGGGGWCLCFLTLGAHLEDSLSLFAVVIFLFPIPYL